MADVKWIKIATGVFDDESFQILDGMPNADAIELIWFKLLVLAGKQNNSGLFLFKDAIPYTDEMLASIFHRSVDTVKLAMTTFVNLKMIDVVNNVYSIPNWDKYQTLDAYERKKIRDAEYQKKRRDKQKELVESKKSTDNRSTVGRDSSSSVSKSNKKKIIDTNYYENEELNKAFLDYLKMRKTIKKPASENAIKLAMGKLDKMASTDEEKIQILEQSIFNSWQGLFELKDKGVKKNGLNKSDERRTNKDVLDYYGL